MEIPPADIARIRDLYAQGHYLQALSASEAFGPIRKWEGAAARLIGGRLAIQLGAPKLGRGLHLLAFRQNPANLEAIYYHARYRLEHFGPLSCWQFLGLHDEWSDASPDLRADWYALHGFVCSRVRDFDRAEKWLTQAEATASDRAWVLVERASVYEAADRLEDALATARRSLELQAWFRPAVQAVAHMLQRSGKVAEAIDFLSEAVTHIESGMVVAQLAALQLDQNRPADAKKSLDRYVELTPLLEPEVAKWLAARRSDVAYLLGDRIEAAKFAKEVDEEFYTAFAERLGAEPTAGAGSGAPPRCLLAVDLDYTGTPPSAAEILAKFWNQPLPPAISESGPALDGLPDASERRRFEKGGWVTREFSLTLAAATDLISREIPFFVTLVDAGYGQSRVVTGYDTVRASLFVADGFDRRPGEAPVKVLGERYAAFGPRCLVAVPAGQAGKLDGIALPESKLHDDLHSIQCLLADRKFAEAKHAIAELRAAQPGHRLTKFADVAWARATAHPVRLLDALDSLLAEFPHDTTLVLSKAAVLRELGRTAARQALLEAEGSKLDAEPLLMQSLAQMLLPDPHRQAEASRLLRRSIRNRPQAAAGYYLLASQWWEHQRFDEAAEAYRFAACLDEREDQFSEAYARVAKFQGQGPDVVRLFQQKATRAAVPSPPAVRALFQALLDRDEPQQAFSALGKSIEKLTHSGDGEPDKGKQAALGELLLFRAEMQANFSYPVDAEADLVSAKPLVPIATWCRAAARVARTKPDYPGALAHVLELLEHDPLNPEAHRIAAGLTAETDGRAAALRHLAQATTKFPDSYPLLRLRAEFLYRDPTDDAAISATQDLITLCPHDAWSHRQLALVYADRRRHEEALAAIKRAGELEPDHPSYFAVLGHVHRRADRIEEAIEVFREGIKQFPDQELLIAELVQVSRGTKEKRAALRYISEHLHTAPHTGDGVVAYFEQASRLVDKPEAQDRLYAEIERFHEERPDLWQCWSLLSQMLVRMHREQEAIAISREATARFPLLARLWVDLAEAYESAGNEEDRLEALRQAVAVAPGWTPVAKELSDALSEAGEDEEAITILTRAVQRNPLDHWARWALADRLWHADSGRLALDQAKAAVRHEPGYDPDRPPTPDMAWNAVVVWSDKLDCEQESLDLARELTRERAGDPRQWLRLARHLYEPAHSAEALAALDKATTLDPRNVEAHDLRAERLAQLGRFDEALEAARPTSLVTELPLVLQGRAAWVEARRGNYAAAIPPMQALVSVDPEYFWGWQQLAEWYNDTNRPENYLEAAGELCRLRPDHPLSLMMRGEARLQTGDRDGGKEDLREVLRLYPNYSPAAAILFDAHLADGEFREARSALAVLQEHMSGPEVIVKQVQYAARQKDEEAAARAFADICTAEGEGPPLFLQMGLAEMRAGGWEERSHKILKSAWQSEDPFNPWAAVYWLDTPEAESAEPSERIAACDALLKHYPRFVPGHDRRAEQLALAGRFDEAAAACTPTDLPQPYPIALRGRAAWIESLRGDRAKAIDLMKQLVKEEPDYAWGWRKLAGWYDAEARHHDFLDAADQLVRLSPDDAFSIGLRGEAKRVLGDHRGAKDDFQRAFDLDPSFDAAGLQLVSEQLATDDLAGAARTLSKLREHADGPLLKLRAVQVAAREGNLAHARAAFKALGADPSASRGILRDAVAALSEAGWDAEADEDLDSLSSDSTVGPAAAGLWADRTIASGSAWKVHDRLPAILSANRAAGREAATSYAWGMAISERPDAVAATVQKYADVLREDPSTWARAGAALAEVKQYAHAVAWFGEWKSREGCESWMLLPLADSLRGLGKDAESEAVCQWAIAKGPEGAVPPDFYAWLALSAAIAGKTAEGTAHLKAIDPVGLDDGVKLVYTMAQAVLRVQRSLPSSRSEAVTESKADLQAAAGACGAKEMRAGTGRWYRKCTDRIAADSGSLSAKLWAFWQRINPWVRES